MTNQPPSPLADLIAKLDRVPRVEYCYCGQPRDAHKFWNDKVYDVQGRDCPGATGGEYRYDSVTTKQHYDKARAQVFEAALSRQPPSPRSGDVEKLIARAIEMMELFESDGWDPSDRQDAADLLNDFVIALSVPSPSDREQQKEYER